MPKGVEQPRGVEHQYDPSTPLIVQGDKSILVEVDNPRYAEARDALAPFAELEKSPEHIHTYRLSPLSLWNAAAAGLSAEAMVDVLKKYSKFPLPANLGPDLAEIVSRYGRVRLEKYDVQQFDGEQTRDESAPAAPTSGVDTPAFMKLVCPDVPLLEELARQPKLKEYLKNRLDKTTFLV